MAQVAIGPAPRNVLLSSEQQPAQHNQPDSSRDSGPAADKEKQKPGTKEAECSSPSQNYYDCLIQLRTARATERQADVAKSTELIAGIALLFAGLAAAAALWAAVEGRRTARAAVAATKVSQTSLRHAGKSAREQLKIASSSADAAVRSANAAEHALQDLERPYLFIEKIDTGKLSSWASGSLGASKPAIDFTVRNYGKTPGIVRWVALRLQSNPDWPLRLPLSNTKAYYTIVEPGKRMIHRSGEDYGTVEVESSLAGQSFQGRRMASLVFQGAIAYEDPSGARHMDRFCLRGNADGASWVIEGSAKHNWRRTYPPKKDEAGTA